MATMMQMVNTAENFIYRQAGEWRMDYVLSDSPDAPVVTASLAKDTLDPEKARELAHAWAMLINLLTEENDDEDNGERLEPDEVRNVIKRQLAARAYGLTETPHFKLFPRKDVPYKTEPVFVLGIARTPVLPEAKIGDIGPLLDIHSLNMSEKEILINNLLFNMAIDTIESIVDAKGYVARLARKRAQIDTILRKANS